MSSRQLRKLQQQRELEQQARNASQENSESESEPETRTKPQVSLFAALGGGDDDDEADLDDQPEVEDPPSPKDEVKSLSQSAASKKSKKKKKKKAKSQGAAVPDEPEASDEDEIDRAMKELNLKTKTNPSTAPTTKNAAEQTIDSLLSINSTHLKALNEMRQLFGREVLESAAASVEADDQARAGRNRRGRAARQQGGNDLESVIRSFGWGKKTLPEISLRRNPFIQGREHWPMATPGGLGMEMIEKRAGETEYAFVHDDNYSSAQAGFFSQVQAGDPNGMIYFLQALPYHVSTTLQVGSIARQQGDIALAGELCERALFTFGRVTTTGFRQDLERGKARLDFRRPENRQFWLAGFHYLRSLVRKGTFRTGLEWAKVLFSLDRSDPYCMRHYIQSLAIRAHEAQWYIDFFESLKDTGDNRDTNYLQQTVALAKLQLGDVAGAREIIADGMKRVSWLYSALFHSLDLDAPPSIWGISVDDAPSRSFWTKLYIYQMKDLWKDDKTTDLLMEVAKSIDRTDAASPPADDPPVDQGAARLVFLEGETSLIAAAPREFLQVQPNYEFDPLPPPREENIFTSWGVQPPFMSQAARDAEAPGEVEQRFRNFLQRHRERAEMIRARHNEAEGEGILTEEELAAQRADEEELQRDLAEYENSPGIFNNLIRMLIGGLESGSSELEREDSPTVAEDAQDEHGEDVSGPGRVSGGRGDVPGAWPEEE